MPTIISGPEACRMRGKIRALDQPKATRQTISGVTFVWCPACGRKLRWSKTTGIPLHNTRAKRPPRMEEIDG